MKTKKFTKVSKGNKNLYWSLTNGFLLSTLENKPMGWKAVYKDNKGYFTFEGINDIRSYFVLKDAKNIIKGLKK